MKRALRPCLCALSLALSLGTARIAAAQTPPQDGADAETLTEAQKSAREHFERAKALYQTGAYRDAIRELEQAHTLDPAAKDLVFNLGIVHERLSAYDDAIAYFQQYIAMETVTDAERAKAETIVRRIEGAKREAEQKKAKAPTPEAGKANGETADDRTPTPAKPAHGRVDAATLTATSLAVVGLGVGAAFGIRALSLDPSGFVTGRDGTYDDLRRRADDAHTSAIVADVGFGVGVISAALATYLYFGRTKTSSSLRASAAPLPGGAAFAVGGVIP